MLKIKQSQVMIAMIDGVGSVAFGILLLQLTGMILWGYLGSAVILGLGAWILIKNQENGHTNGNGYLNMLVFFLSLVWIALAINWIASLILFVVFLFVGFRYYSITIGPNSKR